MLRRTEEDIMFMDGTEYLNELGAVPTIVYSSIEGLKAARSCNKKCGIVAVKVQFVEWVQEPGDSKRSDDGN